MEQRALIRQRVMDSAEPGDIRYKLFEVGWEQKKLYTGDYYFFTHDYLKVGITRKTVEDLLKSIGEIFSKQLEEMIDHYDIKIILLEGSWKKVSTTDAIITGRGIAYQTWDMVWNYLRRWQDKGFTIELTINMGHTIQRLNALYALYQKPYSLSANTRKFTDDRVLAFPSGVRGQTAMNCLDKFGSLRLVSEATVKQLLEINMVGSKKAQLIFNHFNRRNLNEPKPNHN